MEFWEENPQLSIRNHMNSNKEKSQFHVKPNEELTRLWGNTEDDWIINKR